MSNLKHIKTKIKSIGNLKKITKALEIVSTVKLQKTKARVESMKQYIIELMSILAQVWKKTDLFETKLKTSTPKTLIIFVSSDRGLCGSLNSKLIKKFITETPGSKSDYDVFVIGKKGFEFCNRLWYHIVWYINLKDNFQEIHLLNLFTYFEQSVLSNTYTNIKIYFNYFKNILTQLPTALQLYPLNTESFQLFLKDIDLSMPIHNDVNHKDLIIEPDKNTLIAEIRRQIRSYIMMSAIIQNKAWEHASRMLAMKNAKDNSTTYIKGLTLAFNKTRQSMITQEISEIVSAKIAIEW
jgi:F-type H+-transporting ATPase subunit gamma